MSYWTAHDFPKKRGNIRTPRIQDFKFEMKLGIIVSSSIPHNEPEWVLALKKISKQTGVENLFSVFHGIKSLWN